MNPELKREIILEHYQNPRHKQEEHDKDAIKVNSNNESCIDNIDLYLTIQDGIIKDITFNGEACAISTSSTSIMIENLIGKSVEEAKEYIDNFEAMINEGDYNKDILKEALVYDEIYKQNSRKTCATLPYVGIKKAILKYENEEK
jgi:nitrogen fixation NifU-like protein